MLIVKLIKKLQAIAEKLKANAIKKQERKLKTAAEDVDIRIELAEKRLAFAEAIQERLIERACVKLESDMQKCNDQKAKVGGKLDQLNSI